MTDHPLAASGLAAFGLEAPAVEAVVRGDCADPFAILGPHLLPAVPGTGAAGQPALAVRLFDPHATAVELLCRNSGAVLATATCLHPDGFWAAQLPPAAGAEAPAYRFRLHEGDRQREQEDPYRFGPWLGELDSHLLAEGNHHRAYEKLGAHPCSIDGVAGTAFAVWAPNARRVSVVGDFNNWDGRRHPMRNRSECGVWEIFVPHVQAGDTYKFELRGADGTLLPLKFDPYAFHAEVRPANASVVHGLGHYDWADGEWLRQREQARGCLDAPLSIYEVHLGSWRRVPDEDNRFLTYRELADVLVPYVQRLGFTHIELLPVHEHPFDGSWGYQPIGLFAPTSRFGTPDDFKALVEACHVAGIGVIIDWVPGHFPKDAHGLGYFDGTHLYEHADPRQGEHMDWGTLIYNFGRSEVRNFLIANALYWIREFHIDGLRVDAVASMLYLNYSRNEGEWIPNQYGGNENLEAIDFLKRLNEAVYGEGDGAITLAEESTAWPMVSRPTWLGGLGFGFKWNMGWMHDTLEYFSKDPVHRRFHQNQLTFGLLYAFSENFCLPLSHDEVVHGKGSMLGRMAGDEWQKFANLRAFYGFMWAHPGKKLLFMGGEFAQGREWAFDQSLDWHLLEYKGHAGVLSFVEALNSLYQETPALYQQDFSPHGFEWIDCQDADSSVLVWLRWPSDGSAPLVALCNLTPLVRTGYHIGLPQGGRWTVILNSDDAAFGGSGVCPLDNNSAIAREESHHGRPFSLPLTLPPLSTVWLQPA